MPRDEVVDRAQEAAPPQQRNRDRREQCQTDGEHQEALEARGEREGVGPWLLDDHLPPQRCDWLHDADERLAARGGVLGEPRTRRLRARLGNERVRCEVLAARHARFVVGVAVREQASRFVDEQRVTALADPDAIDQVPQLLEPQGADQEAHAAARLVEPERHFGERQLGLVDLHGRDEGARAGGGRRLREAQTRAGEPARHERPARRIEERQLAHFRKLQHVVAEDAFLLPALERRVAQVGGDGFDEVEVVRDVAVDLLRGARGHRARVGGDRLRGARSEELNRDEPVGDERRDRGGCDEQDQPRPDRRHSEAGGAARHWATVLKTSRSCSRGTMKRRLTARVVSDQ